MAPTTRKNASKTIIQNDIDLTDIDQIQIHKKSTTRKIASKAIIQNNIIDNDQIQIHNTHANHNNFTLSNSTEFNLELQQTFNHRFDYICQLNSLNKTSNSALFMKIFYITCTNIANCINNSIAEILRFFMTLTMSFFQFSFLSLRVLKSSSNNIGFWIMPFIVIMLFGYFTYLFIYIYMYPTMSMHIFYKTYLHNNNTTIN